jgi:hypothetical protein
VTGPHWGFLGGSISGVTTTPALGGAPYYWFIGIVGFCYLNAEGESGNVVDYPLDVTCNPFYTEATGQFFDFPWCFGGQFRIIITE